jgi:hypothetical protein
LHRLCTDYPDEVGANRGSRGGVVFANRAGVVIRYKEGIAQQREQAASPPVFMFWQLWLSGVFFLSGNFPG